MKLIKRFAWVLWAIPAALVVGAGTLALVYFLWFQPQHKSAVVESDIVATAPQPVSVRSNTLFFGNVYWGRYINDWSMASPLKTAYPFSRLHEFKRDSYDAWIAGLECPTVAGFSQTSLEEDTTLSFNCSPDYLPQAAKWFSAFTLANNHTDNRGEEGFEETKRQLDAHGIQYFGHHDPYVQHEACEVLALPVTVTYDNKETKKRAIPVAFCGFHGVFKIPPAETIAQIKQYAKVMPVIAMPHMGAEYTPGPDELKTRIYRSLIDAGADMVLGDHPHWVQTTEAYKGKLIVYSMGNFIFDQQGSIELTRSAAINVDIKTTYAPSEDIHRWVALGEKCAVFKDDCLQQAIEKNLAKLPFEYTFGVVGTNNEGKLVRPATATEQAAILQRLNWQRTMEQLR